VKIFGFTGGDPDARQALILRLVPLLTARGLGVSVALEADPAFDLDRPGKDSHKHRQAGAKEVMISSARRWALMHEQPDSSGMNLEALIARMAPIDLLLVDGFDSHDHQRLEVCETECDRPPDPRVVARAGDSSQVRVASGGGLPLFDLTDGEAIADFIVDCSGF
jgi:molybdopterin-guanine dinucleotide biosynthesis protein B